MVVGGREIRIELDCALEVEERIDRAPGVQQRESEIAARRCLVRKHGGELLETIDGELRAADLQRERARIVERGGVGRMVGEISGVGVFGFGETAGLMQAECEREPCAIGAARDRLNARHRWSPRSSGKADLAVRAVTKGLAARTAATAQPRLRCDGVYSVRADDRHRTGAVQRPVFRRRYDKLDAFGEDANRRFSRWSELAFVPEPGLRVAVIAIRLVRRGAATAKR